MGEFGDTFRKEREKQGISLEDVSSVTKISARMLRAIEEEHFDQLPGGVFNKGFIRTYAKHLGLNDDEAVASYLACIRQAQLDAQATWDYQARRAGSQGGPNQRGMTSARAPDEELPELQLPRAEHVAAPRRDYLGRPEATIPWRLLALVILVVVLAAILLHRNSGSARPQAAATTPAVTPAPQPTPPAAISPTPVPTPPRTQRSAAAPVSLKPSTQSGPSPATTQPALPVPVKAAANTTDISNKFVELQDPQPSAASTAPLTLVIRASEDSWISVSADGENVLHETLIAPAHTTVRAVRRIALRVGNAAGVSFVWNGQEIPAQGVEGEVKALVFDATGMQVFSPPAAPAQNP